MSSPRGLRWFGAAAPAAGGRTAEPIGISHDPAREHRAVLTPRFAAKHAAAFPVHAERPMESRP